LSALTFVLQLIAARFDEVEAEKADADAVADRLAFGVGKRLFAAKQALECEGMSLQWEQSKGRECEGAKVVVICKARKLLSPFAPRKPLQLYPRR
jgi:hypothetical protein